MYSGRDIISYHQRTKHHPQRYARSLGYLDWATQPDPFRRYHGARLLPLPLSTSIPSCSYDSLWLAATPCQSLSAESLGAFLANALGLSAWKEYGGNRWELRCNPSSGNLHPTEGYCVLGPDMGVLDTAAVCHYAPREHGLELRAVLGDTAWQALSEPFPRDTFFAGLSSIHWREAWKYGERAWRYCQHDVGHALAALSLSAASLGWRLILLDGASDEQIRHLLGLPAPGAAEGPEPEAPDLLCAVVPAGHVDVLPATVPMITSLPEHWHGAPNPLSADHVEWSVIDEVATASEKLATEVPPYAPIAPVDSGSMNFTGPGARQIFQQRRSAVAMDGKTDLEAGRFYQMLQRCCAGSFMPWWSWPHAPEVHLALFVHRVRGLEPGLYLLVRNADHEPKLREAFRPSFLWERPEGCPTDVPLYRLGRGNLQDLGAGLCCQQEIAGDGAFMAGMIARFNSVVESPWRYRRLFWETGMIGQVLYLEAEAAGLRGTGIGCFFDDAVHDVLGIEGLGFQSLYHFTLGGPVEDSRLRTLPPYPADRYT